jgi:hypothetical protein
MLCVLNKNLMMDWFSPKHVAKVYGGEYKVRFDRLFILFLFIRL